MCALCDSRCAKYILSNLTSLFASIFSKYISDVGFFSIFDIKVEYNYLAVNLFSEAILVVRLM